LDLCRQDKIAKSRADLKTLEEQSKRELAAAKNFAIQRLARDLLETVDNLNRAAKMVNAEAKADAERHPNFATLLEDVDKVEAGLLKKLLNAGVETIDPEGEKFDPNVHEATFEMPMPGKEAGTVFYVEQKGYALNGRVLRPAKVSLPLFCATC
jgi:molecular chaperone GrpE